MQLLAESVQITTGGAITAGAVLLALAPILWRLVNMGLDRIIAMKGGPTIACQADQEATRRMAKAQAETAENVRAISEELRIQTLLYKERSAFRDRQLERVEEKINKLSSRVA